MRTYGKKIDKVRFVIHGKVQELPLYFDGKKFSIKGGDEWFTEKDINKLKSIVEERLLRDDSVVLKPYVQVRLDATRSRRFGNSHSSFYGHDDDPVIGISLSWRIVELSDDEPRLGRDVERVDGKLISNGEIRQMYGIGDLIPYSDKVVDSLEAISAAIATLHTKLEDLLENGDVRKKLESMKGFPQLGIGNAR